MKVPLFGHVYRNKTVRKAEACETLRTQLQASLGEAPAVPGVQAPPPRQKKTIFGLSFGEKLAPPVPHARVVTPPANSPAEPARLPQLPNELIWKIFDHAAEGAMRPNADSDSRKRVVDLSVVSQSCFEEMATARDEASIWHKLSSAQDGPAIAALLGSPMFGPTADVNLGTVASLQGVDARNALVSNIAARSVRPDGTHDARLLNAVRVFIDTFPVHRQRDALLEQSIGALLELPRQQPVRSDVANDVFEQRQTTFVNSTIAASLFLLGSDAAFTRFQALGAERQTRIRDAMVEAAPQALKNQVAAVLQPRAA